MFGLVSPRRLHRSGVVGMNKRNLDLVAALNPRHLYPRVDDKLQTKLLAGQAGIAIPRLYGVARYQQHVNQLPGFLRSFPSFAIKPSKGSGGKGILVIVGHDGEHWTKGSGETLGELDLSRHVSNILSGLYSLGGLPDVAMIEELVNFSDAFEGFSFQGVPDVRVIVYKGYPVLSMMRLSTRESDGKANLHQGAVGVGINITTGAALRAVQHGRPLTEHPDTGRRLSELRVPEWPTVVHLAASCYEMTEMGYLGADIVLDKEKGPLVLELNARPGLAIQVANGHGMRPRLELIDDHIRKQGPGEPVADRVAFSMRSFG